MANLKDNRITISFHEETKKQLERVAALKGWTQSQLVREIVKEYLKENKE